MLQSVLDHLQSMYHLCHGHVCLLECNEEKRNSPSEVGAPPITGVLGKTHAQESTPPRLPADDLPRQEGQVTRPNLACRGMSASQGTGNWQTLHGGYVGNGEASTRDMELDQSWLLPSFMISIQPVKDLMPVHKPGIAPTHSQARTDVHPPCWVSVPTAPWLCSLPPALTSQAETRPWLCPDPGLRAVFVLFTPLPVFVEFWPQHSWMLPLLGEKWAGLNDRRMPSQWRLSLRPRRGNLGASQHPVGSGVGSKLRWAEGSPNPTPLMGQAKSEPAPQPMCFETCYLGQLSGAGREFSRCFPAGFL